MKVVIIAGGKGTRIASVNNEIPKAMIPIGNKPVLEYQIELAKRYGFEDIILIIGYLGNVIRDYFQDGSRWGVSISYFEETMPLGTAGALPELKSILVEDFFVFYGDTVMDIALDKMLSFHKEKNADASLFLHPNDHPYDSDLVSVNKEGQIIDFFSKPHRDGFVGRNIVNAALYILSPAIINYIPKNKKSDFGKDIFPLCLVGGMKLYGYISSEYIKDMGTPERYKKVSADVLSGKVERLNRKNQGKAIFLDRDGVIVKDTNLLNDPTDLELIKGVTEAIRLINKSDYLAIVVSNQPVIAKNLCSIQELELIHDTLETMLGSDGVYLDAIYYCPHHPDGGFPEERKEYKIICDCRKPKPGMLINASKEWNIDLSKSYMIGDRVTDVEAGKNAGVSESFLIEQNKDNSLLNIITKILEHDNIQDSI